MKNFSIIAAIDEKNGIAKNGKIPWYIPEDLKRFHELTTYTKDSDHQNALIMGRKAWEALPPEMQPFPGRINVVLSSSPDLDLPEGVLQFESLDQALMALSSSSKIEHIFVIGGGEVFNEAIINPALEKIHLTKVEGDFNCDTFFPDEIPEEFDIVSASEILRDNNQDYEFLILEPIDLSALPDDDLGDFQDN